MKIYNKSLKLVFALLAMSMLTTNCSDDFLEQKNPNAITPSSFWANESDATKGIYGAYSPFTHIWYYTRFEIFISDYRDDVVNGYNTSERTAVGYFSGTSDSNATFWCWQAMFQGVARANEAIYYVPNIEMDATLRNNILGEAYFIRAFNYFNLLNNWKNLPLITIPSSLIEDTQQVGQEDPATI